MVLRYFVKFYFDEVAGIVMIGLSTRNRMHKIMSENRRFSSPPVSFKEARTKKLQQPILPESVSLAISGDRGAIQLLVNNLTPVIQLAIVHVLKRRPLNQQHNYVHLEVADHCQDVFILLFKNNSKILREWNPDKGMNLKSYVSLIAKRRVISSLRKIEFTQSLDDDSINENIDTFLKTPDEGNQFVNRHLLFRIINSLKDEISEFGYDIFVQIFLYGFTAEEISHKTNLSKNAIYVWKNRLIAHVKKISVELELGWQSDNSSSKQTDTTKRRSVIS